MKGHLSFINHKNRNKTLNLCQLDLIAQGNEYA